MGDQVDLHSSSEELLQRALAPGLPRPTALWTRRGQEPKRLPVPFINAEQALKNNWTSFRSDTNLGHMSLCGFCGIDLPRPHVYMSMGNLVPTTSGPGQCLRCGLIAARVCPHFADLVKEGKPVAYLWEGQGLGVKKELLDSALEDDASLRDGVIPLTLQDLTRLAKESA